MFFFLFGNSVQLQFLLKIFILEKKSHTISEDFLWALILLRHFNRGNLTIFYNFIWAFWLLKFTTRPPITMCGILIMTWYTTILGQLITGVKRKVVSLDASFATSKECVDLITFTSDPPHNGCPATHQYANHTPPPSNIIEQYNCILKECTIVVQVVCLLICFLFSFYFSILQLFSLYYNGVVYVSLSLSLLPFVTCWVIK